MISLVVAIGACRSPKPAGPLPPLPPAAYAHYLDGKLAVFRDDWPAAIEALTAAARVAPDQPMIAVALARAQHKAKRPAAARETLATARRQWPRHAQVWLASGDTLASFAPAEAIRAYRRAIELEPSEERGYLGLAKLEQPQAALATLRRLVERLPDSVDGRYRLAQRLARLRELGGAIEQLRAVLEHDPDHIDARLDLARALRLEGKLDEAVAQTRSAFDRSGQALDVAEELFWLLCELDDRTAAIDLLTLLDDDRSDPEALVTVARLDRGLGRIAEARAIAARIAKHDAELGSLTLAEAELADGDPAAAVKRALAIPQTSERFADARRIVAAAHLAAAAPEHALAALAPARAARPRDLELATLAAFALVELGKLAEANAALDPLGEKPAALVARARLADHAGDQPAALAIAEALVRAKPDITAALNLAGYLLADRNERLADAERYLRRARELAPGDPAILDSWGWLRFRQGHTREAVRVLARAARFAPREAEILVHLAAAWAGDGAPRTADRVLDRAAALGPSAAIQRRITAVRAGLRLAPGR